MLLFLREEMLATTFEIDCFRLAGAKFVFDAGLVRDRLLTEAEAGSLGGGIFSNLTLSAVPVSLHPVCLV